ncbi:MAG: hypothetical protein ABI851_03920 [Saprospiraceae bacterium]
MNKRIILFGLALLLVTFNSCIVDPLLDEVKTEITIVFSAGPYAGQELKFESKNTSDDLNFYFNNNVTRVYCKPLISVDGRAMNSSSSINFAWQGSPGSGDFSAVNFVDVSSVTAGDIELSYADGELLSCSIPKSALLKIDAYLEPNNLVSGTTTFSSILNYDKNGSSNVYQSQCTLTFNFLRGADK